MGTPCLAQSQMVAVPLLGGIPWGLREPGQHAQGHPGFCPISHGAKALGDSEGLAGSLSIGCPHGTALPPPPSAPQRPGVGGEQ